MAAIKTIERTLPRGGVRVGGHRGFQAREPCLQTQTEQPSTPSITCMPASGAPPGTGPAPTDRAPCDHATTDPWPRAAAPAPTRGHHHRCTTDRPPPLALAAPGHRPSHALHPSVQRHGTAATGPGPPCPGLDERGTAAPQPGTRKGKGTPATPLLVMPGPDSTSKFSSTPRSSGRDGPPMSPGPKNFTSKICPVAMAFWGRFLDLSAAPLTKPAPTSIVASRHPGWPSAPLPITFVPWFGGAFLNRRGNS